jgi:hypothetical protein
VAVAMALVVTPLLPFLVGPAVATRPLSD